MSRTLQQAAQTLQEVAESLAATQTSFGNALFHMPRPSEFEPLAEPLREFARVAPVLSRELGATARSIAELQTVTSRLEGLLERLPQAGGARALSGNATLGSAPTLGLAPRIDAARRAVSDALASLPNETDYVPVARQLRELASVSPSLLAWLEEIPKLSAPLSASVANLRAAERLLFETHDELIEAPPAPAERAAG